MSAIVLKGSTSGTVTLQPAATISPNVTFTLPSVDGTSGQVLATNGSGTLSFITNDGTASFAAANSAGSYANGAFAKANTVNVNSQAAFDLANTLFDGTADLNVSSIILGEGLSIIADQVSSTAGEGNGGFLNLTAADTRLGNDAGNVRLNAESYYVTLANTDGTLTVPGNISGANVITANTIVSVDVISSNTITANNLTVSNNFSVSGVTVQWHPAPATSKGHTGDKAGYVAIDNDKIYRCVADYTDGTADIWVYVNFTGGTWG